MYKLINPSSVFTEDILDVVCRNRGVDKEKIKNPSINDVVHYSKLKNIDKAIKVFKKIISKGKVVIAIIIDADPDGYTSAASLAMYIEKHFPHVKLHFIFHKGKTHGLTDSVVKQILAIEDLDLVIVPDAGSNDFDKHKLLHSKNIPVLIIDHHEVTNNVESEYAIVVNSQLSPDYSNKMFSGVGIVYKFLQALDDEFGFNDADTYLDLVSLGNVADIMDLSSPETRYFAYKGLTQIKNGYLKEMIYKNIGKYDKLYPYSLSFNLIPKMNAIIRVGTQEEKEELFYALIGREETFYNTRTKKDETLQYKMTRIGTNVHKRQGDTKKKWIKTIKERVEAEGIDKNNFIIVTFKPEDKFDKSLTGVVASALTSYYRKPVLIMHHNKEKKIYHGSLRGYDSVLKDTKLFLSNLNLFNYVEGHAQAGGVEIAEDKIGLLNQAINSNLQSDSTEQQLIDVDFVVAAQNVNKTLIENVYSYEKYWGHGIQPPTFAITNVEAKMKSVKVSDGGMIKWNMNGIDYTQFTADKRLVDYAEQNKTLTLNVIGKLSVNNFLGKVSYQVMIDDFEILKVEETKGFADIIW